MTKQPLDYAPPQRRFNLRKWLIRTAIALAIVAFLMFGVTVEVQQTEGRIDSVTGTFCRQTTWFGLYKSTAQYDVTPLETQLKARGISWKPTWMFIHNTHYTLFGRAVIFECGSTPPIFHFRYWMDDFVRLSTDKELRDFAHLMESGTDDEQFDAIIAIEAKLKLPTTAPSRER